MKRLIKANNTIDSLSNWIENHIPINDNEYEELIKDYKISGNFYRILGFELSDIEQAIESYYNVDLYDDNSNVNTSKQEFLNCIKTIIKNDGKFCSWTKDFDSAMKIVSEASDYYDINIMIYANVEGIDINKVIDDNKEKMDHLLYTYQNEVLGKQKGNFDIVDIYIGGGYEKIDIPSSGNLNEYINLFEELI